MGVVLSLLTLQFSAHTGDMLYISADLATVNPRAQSGQVCTVLVSVPNVSLLTAIPLVPNMDLLKEG